MIQSLPPLTGVPSGPVNASSLYPQTLPLA